MIMDDVPTKLEAVRASLHKRMHRLSGSTPARIIGATRFRVRNRLQQTSVFKNFGLRMLRVPGAGFL